MTDSDEAQPSDLPGYRTLREIVEAVDVGGFEDVVRRTARAVDGQRAVPGPAMQVCAPSNVAALLQPDVRFLIAATRFLAEKMNAKQPEVVVHSIFEHLCWEPWPDSVDTLSPVAFANEVIAGFVAGADDEPWLCFGFLVELKGALVISQLGIIPNPIVAGADRERTREDLPASGINTDVPRSILLGAILNKARQLLATAPARVTGGIGVVDEAILGQARLAADRSRLEVRRGRVPLPDAFIRGVAIDVLELQREDLTMDEIRKRIAAEHRRSPETVKDWIRKASADGFLTAGSSGRGQRRMAGPRLAPANDTDEEDS